MTPSDATPASAARLARLERRRATTEALEEGASLDTVCGSETDFWCVRHGERVDETSGPGKKLWCVTAMLIA
jgi:hypothetical protein